LLASVAPVALLVTVAAAGLGLEFQWWMRMADRADWPWGGAMFTLNALPLAGWTLLGLSLGVLLGAAIRPLTSRPGKGPDILSSALGWPDGRLLTGAQLHHTAAWFRAHHIQIWLAYQPGSRFFLFGGIEFGWLAVLSALLIGATVLLIRCGAS
jgi:hypothetical protein